MKKVLFFLLFICICSLQIDSIYGARNTGRWNRGPSNSVCKEQKCDEGYEFNKDLCQCVKISCQCDDKEYYTSHKCKKPDYNDTTSYPVSLNNIDFNITKKTNLISCLTGSGCEYESQSPFTDCKSFNTETKCSDVKAEGKTLNNIHLSDTFANKKYTCSFDESETNCVKCIENSCPCGDLEYFDGNNCLEPAFATEIINTETLNGIEFKVTKLNNLAICSEGESCVYNSEEPFTDCKSFNLLATCGTVTYEDDNIQQSSILTETATEIINDGIIYICQFDSTKNNCVNCTCKYPDTSSCQADTVNYGANYISNGNCGCKCDKETVSSKCGETETFNQESCSCGCPEGTSLKGNYCCPSASTGDNGLSYYSTKTDAEACCESGSTVTQIGENYYCTKLCNYTGKPDDLSTNTTQYGINEGIWINPMTAGCLNPAYTFNQESCSCEQNACASSDYSIEYYYNNSGTVSSDVQTNSNITSCPGDLEGPTDYPACSCRCESGVAYLRGDASYSCCEKDKLYVDGSYLSCCDNGTLYNNNTECCTNGTIIDGVCCPTNKVYKDENNTQRCCTSGNIIEGTINGTKHKYCDLCTYSNQADWERLLEELGLSSSNYSFSQNLIIQQGSGRIEESSPRTVYAVTEDMCSNIEGMAYNRSTTNNCCSCKEQIDWLNILETGNTSTIQGYYNSTDNNTTFIADYPRGYLLSGTNTTTSSVADGYYQPGSGVTNQYACCSIKDVFYIYKEKSIIADKEEGTAIVADSIVIKPIVNNIESLGCCTNGTLIYKIAGGDALAPVECCPNDDKHIATNLDTEYNTNKPTICCDLTGKKNKVVAINNKDICCPTDQIYKTREKQEDCCINGTVYDLDGDGINDGCCPADTDHQIYSFITNDMKRASSCCDLSQENFVYYIDDNTTNQLCGKPCAIDDTNAQTLPISDYNNVTTYDLTNIPYQNINSSMTIATYQTITRLNQNGTTNSIFRHLQSCNGTRTVINPENSCECICENGGAMPVSESGYDTKCQVPLSCSTYSLTYYSQASLPNTTTATLTALSSTQFEDQNNNILTLDDGFNNTHIIIDSEQDCTLICANGEKPYLSTGGIYRCCNGIVSVIGDSLHNTASCCSSSSGLIFYNGEVPPTVVETTEAYGGVGKCKCPPAPGTAPIYDATTDTYSCP